MSKKSFYLENLDACRRLAGQLANILKTGDILTFEGTLGAGKTEFCRSIIHSLGYDEDVPSPTFSILQTYEPPIDDLEKPAIWHLDLYRLEKSEDVFELGIEDGLDTAITLIEWPDKMGSYLPEGCLNVSLKLADNEGARHISFSGSEYWEVRLKELEI